LVAAKPNLLAIVGETASGKSDLALKIARDYRGEIISADSWTVYRDFDIGTGKPTITQQKAVKHHLIDVRGPKDGFNAPMFKGLAEKAIQDIQKRGNLPVIAAGTGLYVDSVLYDFGFLPDVPPEERAALNSLEISTLIELAEKLGIDLSGIDTRNKRRIIRAIEAKGERPTKGKLKAGTLMIGLQLDREELRKRVEQRTDKMLAAGLEAEVKDLSDKYGWDIEPMKGIGYREWRDYFAGGQTLDETRQRIISSTMNLAKRQRTWFKRNPDIRWFDSRDTAYRYLIKIL
jgi:tRNA dimethylallyltransferase